jgi:hypothetical protein
MPLAPVCPRAGETAAVRCERAVRQASGVRAVAAGRGMVRCAMRPRVRPPQRTWAAPAQSGPGGPGADCLAAQAAVPCRAVSWPTKHGDVSARSTGRALYPGDIRAGVPARLHDSSQQQRRCTCCATSCPNSGHELHLRGARYPARTAAHARGHIRLYYRGAAAGALKSKSSAQLQCRQQRAPEATAAADATCADGSTDDGIRCRPRTGVAPTLPAPLMVREALNETQAHTLSSET